MLSKIKSHFWGYFGLTGWSFTYLIIIALYLLCVGVNTYSGWQCSNYEEVTGFESKYIGWDACYVKGSDGVFMRYDANYKHVE